MPLSLQFASTSADFGQIKKVYLEGGLVLVSWEPESHARSLPWDRLWFFPDSCAI